MCSLYVCSTWNSDVQLSCVLRWSFDLFRLSPFSLHLGGGWSRARNPFSEALKATSRVVCRPSCSCAVLLCDAASAEKTLVFLCRRAQSAHQWMSKEGMAFICLNPAGAVNKMCLQSDLRTANVCILHLLNPHYLAVIKRSANPAGATVRCLQTSCSSRSRLWQQ